MQLNTWKTWQKWVGGIVAALIVVAPIAWLIGAAMALYSDAKNTSEKASALQALAALAALLLTVLLVIVTAWYAILTREISRKAGRSSASSYGPGGRWGMRAC